MDLYDLLVYSVFFGPPLAAVVWFVISLILFLRTDKSDAKKRGKRKILTIVSGVIAGALVLGIVSMIILVMLAVSHM